MTYSDHTNGHPKKSALKDLPLLYSELFVHIRPCDVPELIEAFLYAGYFPMKLEALPEATVIHSRVPVFQITTSGKYSPLCTYLETLLTMVW